MARTTEQFKRFKRRVCRLLREALRIYEDVLDEETWGRRVERLHDHPTAIYEEPYTDPDCQRIAKGLQNRKEERFTFHEVDGVDWQNNEAERVPRPHGRREEQQLRQPQHRGSDGQDGPDERQRQCQKEG